MKKSNGISLEEIDNIHLGRKAEEGKEYVDVLGNTYYGTFEKGLRLAPKGSQVTFSPTSEITSTNVQGAIEEIGGPTGVTAGTYGDSTHIPRITVGTDGRIEEITEIATSPSADLLVSYVSTVAIAKYDPVTSNGQIADSNVIGHRNKLIGLATESVLALYGSTAIAIGEVTNPAWSWTIGDIIFLNGTTLSKVPPVTGTSLYSQVVGVATKTDTIDIDIKQSFGF